METRTFEYCSLKYLNQWLLHDRRYCGSLTNGNTQEKLTAIKSAGQFYKVARNLPRKFDEMKRVARYQPILDVLGKVHRDQFKDDPVKEILKVERKISKKYGNKSVLSLTTKMLWLKIKDPILIYDSKARTSLGTEPGDLFGYYEKWRENFEQNKIEIEKSCSKLHKVHLYAADHTVGTKDYIKKLASEKWFQERVFDIYLWSNDRDAK